MLKKGLRLRKKEDFDRVFRSGKPLFFHELGCRYLAGASAVRVGFVLSKKHIPNAVARNRIKRVLSEAFFEYQSEWPETGDIVLFTIRKSVCIDSAKGRLLVASLLENLKRNNTQRV